MEMTGLNIETNSIIEIAVIVTDGSLNKMVEGPNIIVNCPEEELEAMDSWCTKTHGESGLT